MIIRDAAPRDFAPIRTCTDAAFGQSAEGALVEALREAGDAEIELVAEEGNNIVGHVLLSKLGSPPNSLGLAPLAVLPSHQRRGIGAELMRQAITTTRRRGFVAIFLLGEPGYYSRFGFSVEAAAKFGTIYPKGYMMALELKPGSLDGLAGDIIYAPAFQGLS